MLQLRECLLYVVTMIDGLRVSDIALYKRFSMNATDNRFLFTSSSSSSFSPQLHSLLSFILLSLFHHLHTSVDSHRIVIHHHALSHLPTPGIFERSATSASIRPKDLNFNILIFISFPSLRESTLSPVAASGSSYRHLIYIPLQLRIPVPPSLAPSLPLNALRSPQLALCAQNASLFQPAESPQKC